MNRNSSRQVRVTTANGSTWVETHRNSFGGWVSMTDRVAQRVDGTNRPRVTGADDVVTTFTTTEGNRFEVSTEVFTEADRVA